MGADAQLETRIDGLLQAGELQRAATEAIAGYGPQILGYLTTLLRAGESADEVFAEFSHDLWNGLGAFRRECSFRTWAYKLAWHAAVRFIKDPYHGKGRRLETAEVSRIVEDVRSRTAPHLRTEVKDRLAELRASLTPEEQTLLVLRIDRDLPWREVAAVLDDDEPALRKRFERLKVKLRELAVRDGLLDG